MFLSQREYQALATASLVLAATFYGALFWGGAEIIAHVVEAL